MSKNTSNKNKGNAQVKNFKQKLNDATKEAKKKEKEEKRAVDYDSLCLICEALNNIIHDIYTMREDAENKKTRLTPDQIAITNITTAKVVSYFSDILEMEYKPSPQVSGLTAILVDIARCQVNTKLTANHVSLRIAYFLDKFQACFGFEYDTRRKELLSDNTYLFDSRYTEIIFRNPYDDDINDVYLPIIIYDQPALDSEE